MTIPDRFPPRVLRSDSVPAPVPPESLTAGGTADSAVPAAAAAVPGDLAVPGSRPWLLGALLLAGAAQLITISALVSADPIPASWAALLLAIAPAPLAAVAVFAPTPDVRRAGAVAAAVILVIGIIAQATHTGLFFVPALAVLIVGAIRLWREQ